MLSGLRAPLAVPAAGLLADILIGICLLVLGVAVGLDGCYRFVGTPQFYQSEFGPAVMVAAGRGFVAPDLKSAPAVADFLFLRRPKLEPAAIPEDVRTLAPNQFHNATRYLEMTVGYWWRIAGISWLAVFAIDAAFYGMSVAAYYGMFRLLLSRPLAVAGALFLCFSPIHLQYVPQLRDYSKAPFMLAAVALIAAPAIRPVGCRSLVALSASCGLVLGLGMGFRMDVAIMVPIFGVSLAAFHGDRPWHDLRAKGIALAAFLLMFTVASAPILIRLRSGGSNAAHVILLGFGDSFDEALGIKGSLYAITPFYNDVYMSSTVQSYAERLHQRSPPLPSAGYDAMSRDYLLRVLRNFPADAFTRVLAAAKGIFDLPFRAGVPELRGRGGTLQALVGKALECLRRLDGYGTALAVFLVAAATIRRPKLGLFVAFFVFALSSYPALQFDPRHFFHLQFIPILGLLLALNVVLSLIATAWRCLRPGALPPVSPDRMDRWRMGKRLALAVGVLAMTTVAPTAALRTYQQRHLASLVGEYLVGPKRAVEPIFTETESGGRIARWGGIAGREYLPGSTVLTDYYMVEFVGAPDSAVDAVGLRYRAGAPYFDYSRIITFSTREGVNRILFPVYGSTSLAFQFDGLDVSALGARLQGIYRLDDLTHRPLLLDLRLHAGWEKEDLFQTLRAEGKTSSQDVRLAEGSSISALSQVSWIGRLASPALMPRPGRVDVLYSNEVRVTRRAIEMDGRAEGRSSFLLRFKPMAIARGAMLLVQGRLDDGGLGIGFLKDERWHGMAVVTQPGEFIAAVEASEDGNYVPVIINATKQDRDRNRFVIRRFGIATATTAPRRGPAPADPGRPTEDP